MELIRYLHNLRASHHGCVATIGNFDGVHLGHQAVINQLHEYAIKMNLPSVVMTFEPQPLEYFSPGTAPPRLTSFREKCELFKACGIDRVLYLRFRNSLASLSAENFVSDLLVDGLGIKGVIVGDDFRFGKHRAGDFQVLENLGKQFGFEVIPTATYLLDGVRVSSSRIRDALAHGRFAEAEALLGRAYRVNGRIVHGDKRGRDLGFPTANIDFGRRKTSLHGIYAVRVFGLGKAYLNGVANIGTRPMFNGDGMVLEIHILDFDETIYGRRIEVEFLKFLRNEEKFASVEELRKQIQRDIDDTRTFFAGLN